MATAMMSTTPVSSDAAPAPVVSSSKLLSPTPERNSSPTAKTLSLSPPLQSKSTDETLSTANCDDSITTGTNMSAVRLFAPPVAAVSVDKRSVRQRLRDQEAKINALLHKPVAEPGVLQKLVEKLESDLKQTQTEKQELTEALDALKKEQEASLKEQKKKDEEAAAVAFANEAQAKVKADILAKRMSRMEVELRHKSYEAALLQDRWDTTVRRMVQYQVDLETHDLHYTDYAAKQFQAGEEAMKEIKGLTSKDQSAANRQVGKKAKHMMSTLLKDLEAMGERYQEARVHQEQQVADLKIAQMEWQRRAEYLEAKCKEHQVEVEDENEPTPVMMSGPLMKFHQKLRLQQTAASESQRELKTEVESARQQHQQVQLERDVLQQEVDRLQLTVTQLQDVTEQQQDALQSAQAEAARAAAAPPKKKKKKMMKFFSLFGKKKKKTPTRVTLQPHTVDVAAALAPQRGESQRFDILHGRLQGQAKALVSLQDEYKRVARQKSQLQQTVSDLRLEAEQTKAATESKTLLELQKQLAQVEEQRAKEQAEARAAMEEMQTKLQALGSSSKE